MDNFEAKFFYDNKEKHWQALLLTENPMELYHVVYSILIR